MPRVSSINPTPIFDLSRSPFILILALRSCEQPSSRDLSPRAPRFLELRSRNSPLLREQNPVTPKYLGLRSRESSHLRGQNPTIHPILGLESRQQPHRHDLSPATPLWSRSTPAARPHCVSHASPRPRLTPMASPPRPRSENQRNPQCH